MLEPIAVRSVAGITGVGERYFDDVVRRHPKLRQLPSAGIPYGGEPLDHVVASKLPGRSRLLERPELQGRIVLAYAGALLPLAQSTLRALLLACREWRESGDPLAAQVRLLFVGTGSRPNDPQSGVVEPIARACGASKFVVEIAERQPYVDVLHMLSQVKGVMILGSSERHYTASKSFQALMSRRPILGLLHADSTASMFLASQSSVSLVTFTEHDPVENHIAQIKAAILAVAESSNDPVSREGEALEALTAREVTRRLARFFDEVLDQYADTRARR
jgi:hypothetical protein